ncbi:transposase domain protein [Escherichia coli TW14301]|nr:transposase domain protein [Escherichia coli FRIK1996]EIN59632.1 transposase domain protein [Escherichia coli PA3]EIO09093.1 transposase domain protein [Escherichia coli PA28]EIP14780.1 transposase domain protein [Escherichia coli TW14301]EIP42441.1 transposase domain protein [Escherichia coli EC4439]EIP55264.1 transposase domain protein [Escherichia coli EC4436]EIP79867.1 transposase domain protein [Escherichia coli EC1863]EKH45014.1 transposase domain protein [Escherichia coli NE1487]E
MRGSLLSVDNSRTAEQQNSRTAEQKKEPKNDGQILYQFC